MSEEANTGGMEENLQPLAMLATGAAAAAQESEEAVAAASAAVAPTNQGSEGNDEEEAMMAAAAAEAHVKGPPEDDEPMSDGGEHLDDEDSPMKQEGDDEGSPDSPRKKKRRRSAPFNAKKNFHIASSRPFNDMLFELINYKIAHGDVKVPPSNSALYPWVYELRRKMRLVQQHQNGKLTVGEPQSPCDLTQKRVDVLDHLGFVWDTFKEDAQQKWNKYYQQLTVYKEKNGHCNVPAKEGELGAWVKQQRYCKTVADQKDAGTLRKTCKSGAMSKERQTLLENIGFQWKVAPPITGWNNRYEQLLAYKNANGHCNVPQYYKPDKYFGRWVMKQRHEHSLKLRGMKSQLTDEREEKLNTIGFRWVAPGFQKKSVEYHPEDEEDNPTPGTAVEAAAAALNSTPTLEQQANLAAPPPQGLVQDQVQPSEIEGHTGLRYDV